MVPQRAVNEFQGCYQVAVVGPDNKVQIRPVKAGERVGVFRVVSEGLKADERVVVEGIQKVREGMTVNSKPFSIKSMNDRKDVQAPQNQSAATGR